MTVQQVLEPMPPSHLVAPSLVAGVDVPTTSRVCANRYLYRVNQTATRP